jgi:hypothetical protein
MQSLTLHRAQHRTPQQVPQYRVPQQVQGWQQRRRRLQMQL